MKTYSRVLSIAMASLLPMPVIAGGPLVLEGTSGNTPVSYAGPVILNFDQGPLLNGQTNTQADDLVVQAINVWNNVSTATVQISKGVDLPTNYDSTNYSAVLDRNNNGTFSDDVNPVLYDEDGGIIDDFFGVDASDGIGGFAASIFTVSGTSFVEGYVVLNGKPSLGFSSNDVQTVVVHEVGHLIGLDHSQLNIDNTEFSTGSPGNPATICNTAPDSAYPAMYPFLCRDSQDLHVDDEIAVSALYPVSNLDQQYGQIYGVFVDAVDIPILGANLWVEETTTGDVISIVSDYLTGSNGFFSLYVPPGTYTLHANAINSEFDAESSVGPYASSPSDRSFADIPAELVAPAIVDFQADTGSTANITIAAGEAVSIRFRVDGTGTSTGGNVVADPETVSKTFGGGSGGGSSHIGLTVLLLLPAFLLRRRISSI